MAEILYSGSQNGAANSRAEDHPSAPESTADLLASWYLLRQGRFWCIANCLAAVLATSLTWDKVAPSIILSWCLFICLNAGLFFTLVDTRRQPKPSNDAEAGHPMIFFAAVFGCAWGALVFLSNGHIELSTAYQIQMIVLAIVGSSIPVFALNQGSFTTFTLALIFPCLAAAWQQDAAANFKVFFLLIMSLYLVAAYFAATQRALAEIVEKFLELGRNDAKRFDGDAQSFVKLAHKRHQRIARQLPGQARAKSSLDAVGDGVISINSNGIVEYINPIAEVMTGTTRGEAHGQLIDTLLRLKCEETLTLVSDVTQNIKNNPSAQLKRRATLIREDGIEYHLELIVVPHSCDDEQSDGATFVLRDLGESQTFGKEATWKASHDPLTKLLNRIEFESRVKNLFEDSSAESQKSHAICVLDLDKFQYLNETYGHQSGDKALVALAEEFRAKIRGADILARVGDNKFAVLLYACERDKARMIAEGLRRIAEETRIEVNGNDFRVTISAGVVAFSPQDDEMTDILVAADSACVNAKKEGGNRVFTILDNKDTSEAVSRDITRLRTIQSALQENRLLLQTRVIHDANELSHQAIEETSHRGGQMCEILLRMEDSDGKLSAPREMLATAEKFQIMSELDRWATKASLDAVRLGHPKLKNISTIFISLSGQSLNDDHFLEFLLSELEDENLPAERLCFEISHASLIASVDRASLFIANLKEFGCQVALNDFGFAMHAFELLKRLQIDYLKIDSQFVKNMIHNSVDYEIVLALSRIAKTLKIQTIAEGVATMALKETLVGIGIDYLQGMLIDEPESISSPTVH